MARLSLVVLLLAGLFGNTNARADSAGTGLVPFASPESTKRLARTTHAVDFFHLANHFASQSNIAFCGPTSAVIVLNQLLAYSASCPRKPPTTCTPALRTSWVLPSTTASPATPT